MMNDGGVVGILTKQGIARTLGAIDDIAKPASSLHVTKAMDDTFTVISGALPVGEVSRLLESSGVIRCKWAACKVDHIQRDRESEQTGGSRRRHNGTSIDLLSC